MKDLSKVRNTIPPSRKGAKMSEDAKSRISETCKQNGIGKWMKGRKLSEGTKKKISENNSRYWLGKKRGAQSFSANQKRSLALLGHAVSEKTKQRIGNLNKGKFYKNHPCYKEEKFRPLYKAVRESYKYRKWRTDIFTRDNFSCVLCGKYKTYIEADHFPKQFIIIVRENKIKTLDEAISCKYLWDTNNGRTLCLPCHRKTPTWGKHSFIN